MPEASAEATLYEQLNAALDSGNLDSMIAIAQSASAATRIGTNRRYLICSVDFFAGFAHAITTYLAGVSLADLHGMPLIYQPLKVAHGTGFAWEDFFGADPRGLVPPLVAPVLAVRNRSGLLALLVDGLPVRLQQVMPTAGPQQIATMLTSSKPNTVTWLRKGRNTFPACNDRCEILAEIQHAGLWLRERFWQAVHARSAHARRARATAGAASGTLPDSAAGSAPPETMRPSNMTTVAIHVRRGDVTWLDRYGKPSHRWVETSSVIDVLAGLRDIFGVAELSPRHGVDVALYSEAGWLSNDTVALRRVAPHVVIHTDSTPAQTISAMVAMASADVLLLGSSGFSTFAGLFSCGMKIGAADTGVGTKANLTLPLRHVFFPTSLTARSTPFMSTVGERARAVWLEYIACKRDADCRRTRLCSAAHLSDPRWARSRLARRAIADTDGLQWQPPPPYTERASMPQLAVAAKRAAAAALEPVGFPAAAAVSSRALGDLWERTCLNAAADPANARQKAKIAKRPTPAAQPSCLRQSWGRNLSSWLSMRRLVTRGAASAAH